MLDNAASSRQVVPLLPGGNTLVLVTSRRHLGDLPGAVVPLLLAMAAENDTVAAAFELSYRHLDPARQRFFAVLGLHPADTTDPYAAAALTGTSLADATAMLDGLHGEGLLTETGYRRYNMHDLLRRYARDHAAAISADDAQQALGRLLDYYTHTAARADAWLARQTSPAQAPTTSPARSAAAPGLADAEQALAWARAERASLLACLDHATREHQHARVIALTAALAELLRRDGPWTDAITRHTTALHAACHLGDKPALASTLNNLGIARRLTCDYPGAARDLEQALAIFRDLGDRGGEAEALNETGTLYRLRGEPAKAQAHHQQALELARAIGSAWDEAHALAGLGRCAIAAADLTTARASLGQAAGIFQHIGAPEATVVTAELAALNTADPAVQSHA